VLSHAEFNATAFVLPDQMRQYAEEQRLKPFHRWQTYSRQLRKDPALLAYYTFELSSDDSTSILPNLSSNGHALDGHVVSGDWVDGRFSGKRAVYFHGFGSGDYIALPAPERFEFPGAFSVAVWFKVLTGLRTHDTSWMPLVCKGEHSWRLQYMRDADLSFDTNNAAHQWLEKDYFQQTKSHLDLGDKQWHLVVAVYKPQDNVAQKQLYVDGRMISENAVPMPRERGSFPARLGASVEAADHVFSGLIDEAAFFSRAISAEEVAAMFHAGNPEQ
jgi:hypothetical protein